MRAHLYLLVTSALFVSFAAHAQGASPLQAKTLDQYPSFLEVTGEANGVKPGSQFDLRCGLNFSNGNFVLNNFLDITFLNETTNEYARYQNIYGKYTVMSFAPNGGGKRMLAEVIEPDGSVRAKNCLLDTNKDVLSDCQPAAGFITSDQAQQWLQIGAQSCQAAMIQKAGDLKKTPPNPQELSGFEQKLRQEISILEN